MIGEKMCRRWYEQVEHTSTDRANSSQPLRSCEKKIGGYERAEQKKAAPFVRKERLDVGADGALHHKMRSSDDVEMQA